MVRKPVEEGKLMKEIDLGYRKVYKTDIDMMDIKELNVLIIEIQEIIHLVASEKQTLTTLPRKKKNGYTINKVTKLNQKLMYLQDATNYISVIRKNKRDVMQNERDWLKVWFKMASQTLKPNQIAKLTKETNECIGYSLD